MSKPKSLYNKSNNIPCLADKISEMNRPKTRIDASNAMLSDPKSASAVGSLKLGSVRNSIDSKRKKLQIQQSPRRGQKVPQQSHADQYTFKANLQSYLTKKSPVITGGRRLELKN